MVSYCYPLVSGLLTVSTYIFAWRLFLNVKAPLDDDVRELMLPSNSLQKND